MYETGYADFYGISCVYFEYEDGIRLVPKEYADYKKMLRHANDQKFLFDYVRQINQKSTVFINRVERNVGGSLTLIPEYAFLRYSDSPISLIEITGQALDAFFNPARYFFDKNRTGETATTDLRNNTEIADRWSITISGKIVNIELHYGRVLRGSLSGPLTSHPSLRITFEETTDVLFFNQVGTVIKRFLQIVQYSAVPGLLRIELFSTEPLQHRGSLSGWCSSTESGAWVAFEAEYHFFKPYIQNLLQFTSDNWNVSLRFMPTHHRFYGRDYSTDDVTALFSAFESEYKLNEKQGAFSHLEKPNYADIKECVLERIRDCRTPNIGVEEAKFLDLVHSRISDIGNQVGQSQKIKNVLAMMETSLKSSEKHLFLKAKNGSENELTQKDIKIIAEKIVGLRSKAAHEHEIQEFNDEQAKYIRFLEVLVYALMLKRAHVDDPGIELLLGLVLHCNNVYIEHFC